MGHTMTKSKIDVQKEKLKNVFYGMIHTNIAIMEFQKTLTDKEEEIKTIKKVINLSKKALDVISNVQHFEILVSLYNSFINGKESYYVTLIRTITLKTTIQRWDKSKKGFDEFLKMEIAAKSKSEQELKERQEQAEFIKKAQQEGKKIDFAFKDGKIQPVVVEEKAN